MTRTPRTAVVTLVHGRHEHLRRQREGLSRQTSAVHAHVVVRMADDVRPTSGRPELTLVDLPTTADGLPLARARNVGASAAIALGAELLVFLDVDCIPGDTLVQRYQQAFVSHREAVLGGPVTYLPPPGADGYVLDDLPASTDPHPARPAPPPGEVHVDVDAHRLFWSLSFALGASLWQRVEGFDEAYVGYGGEDTDFGQRLRVAGAPVAWVGGADAFHQHHPVSRPPVEHVDDVVRNAWLFHDRWGWWPMEGWLDAFEERGLVAWTDGGPRLVQPPA